MPFSVVSFQFFSILLAFCRESSVYNKNTMMLNVGWIHVLLYLGYVSLKNFPHMMIRVNDVTCMYYMNSQIKRFDVIAALCTGMTWSIQADMNPLIHVESFCIIYGFMSALKSLSRRSLKDHTGPWLNLCWHRILMRWMIYNETYGIAISVQRFCWNMRQS